MVRCRVLLGVVVATWAIGTSSAVAGPVGVEDTVRSVVGAVPEAEAPPSSLPPVEVPSVPQVTSPPEPHVTPPTPPVSKASASAGPVDPFDDPATEGPGAAADPSGRNRASGDVGYSPGIPNPASGKSGASRGGPGGATTDPHRAFSTPSAHRHRWVASNVKASLPRWLAYVWPAVALGRRGIVIPTLNLILNPEAGTPLLISAPLALLGLNDAAHSSGPAPDVTNASAVNEPSARPIHDVGPGVDVGPGGIEMLLILMLFLALSYFIFWSEGVGSRAKHRQG
jgi:hypothetical protein